MGPGEIGMENSYGASYNVFGAGRGQEPGSATEAALFRCHCREFNDLMGLNYGFKCQQAEGERSDSYLCCMFSFCFT